METTFFSLICPTHLYRESNHKVDPLAERMHTMATRLDGIQEEIDSTVAIRPPKKETQGKKRDKVSDDRELI